MKIGWVGLTNVQKSEKYLNLAFLALINPCKFDWR